MNMPQTTHKPNRPRKAQISLEFLIVTSLVLLTFMVMGYIIYERYVMYTDLALDMKLRELANKFAENINQMVIVGDGYMKYITLQTRYPGDEYNITFTRDDPKVLVENQWNRFAPLLTTNVYCCLPECETLCEKTVYTVNSSRRIKAENLNNRIYIGGACIQDRALISEWKFDEGAGGRAFDSWGANTAYLNGSVAWSAGNCTNATSFSGEPEDYITVLDDPSLNFDEGDDFTLIAWVRSQQAAQAGNWPTILSKENGSYDPGTRVGYDIILRDSNVNPNWAFKIYISGRDAPYQVNGSYIADNSWHFIAAMRNGSKIQACDDLNMGCNELSASNATLFNYRELRIGKFCNDTYPFSFNGSIDNVKIFKRALTPNELLAEYENGV